jgi:tRNA threonylcarbamoyladenosine biosynthesis protein TsaB
MISFLINTSKPEVLVALVKDGNVLGKETWVGDKTTGTKLLSVIDELLVENNLKLEDIDRVGVHPGPGHYSALRSGIVTATFLAEGAKAELVSVKGEALEEMAKQVEKNEPVEVVVPIYS